MVKNLHIRIPTHCFETPKFSWIKCCKNCPSRGQGDPESLDIYSWSFEDRIDTTFACAWRPKGNCYLNQKKTFYGSDDIV